MRVAHGVFARGRFKIICECCRFVSRHPAGVEAVQLKLDYLTHLSSIQRLNNISSPSTHSAVRAYVGQAGKHFCFFVFKQQWSRWFRWREPGRKTLSLVLRLNCQLLTSAASLGNRSAPGRSLVFSFAGFFFFPRCQRKHGGQRVFPASRRESRFVSFHRRHLNPPNLFFPNPSRLSLLQCFVERITDHFRSALTNHCNLSLILCNCILAFSCIILSLLLDFWEISGKIVFLTTGGKHEVLIGLLT